LGAVKDYSEQKLLSQSRHQEMSFACLPALPFFEGHPEEWEKWKGI